MTLRRSLALAFAALAVPVLLAACSSGPAAATLPPIPSAAPATPTPAPTHPGPTYPPGCPTAQPAALGAGQTRTVTIATDKGDIVIKITADLAPIATGNFVALAGCGYYDGVIFHRVVPGFVIQGGDGQFGRMPDVYPDLVGSGGPPYTIQDDPVTAKYHRGIVAMARTSEPNSAGSQFFIVLDDAAVPALSQANTYQIMGEVTSGMEAVDAIAAAADKENPTNPVVMTKVTVATP
ncbi:MAG TPA: peptidylprolyl isomerase [Candidatus Limnocylindrales bacterium]